MRPREEERARLRGPPLSPRLISYFGSWGTLWVLLKLKKSTRFSDLLLETSHSCAEKSPWHSTECIKRKLSQKETCTSHTLPMIQVAAGVTSELGRYSLYIHKLMTALHSKGSGNVPDLHKADPDPVHFSILHLLSCALVNKLRKHKTTCCTRCWQLNVNQ